MKAGIFLVGTELLNGATIDTNSIYIAEELNKYGIEIEFKMTVRDVMSEITKALTYAKKNVDLVILTGGLGPTDDDITKEAMAKFLKKKLVVDEKEKKELRNILSRMGILGENGTEDIIRIFGVYSELMPQISKHESVIIHNDLRYKNILVSEE